MPGNDSSNSWTFRVTTDDEVNFLNLFESKAPVSFLMFNTEHGKTSGNRHHHGLVIWHKPITRNIIEGIFKRAGYVGNKQRQCKVWDGNHDYIRYMHKEDRNPIISKGTIIGLKTPEEYVALEQAFVAQYKDVQKKLKDKAKTNLDLVQLTLLKVKEQLTIIDGYEENPHVEYRGSLKEQKLKVIKAYEAVLDEHNQTPANDFHVVNHINKVMFLLNGRELRDNWRTRINEKLMSRYE